MNILPMAFSHADLRSVSFWMENVTLTWERRGHQVSEAYGLRSDLER